MNEIKAKADYQPEATASEMVKKAAKSKHEFGSRRANGNQKSEEVAAPVAGKVATQRDIADLHKRMVQMFTTLNDGLSATALAKAAKDREELCARLDETERAVNSMEGLLRIEFAPQIRSIIHEEMDDHRQHQKTGWRGAFFWMLSSAAFLTLGAVFSGELIEYYEFFLNYILQAKDAFLAN